MEPGAEMEDQLPAAEAAAVHVQEAREHHVLAELAAAEAQSNATAHVLEMTQLLQITVQPAATAEL
jgi:hypothetical protein